MRRPWLYIGGGLVALVLLFFLGLLWLLNTASGARFAVTSLAGLAGVELSVRQVEGRLMDRLRLTGVRVSRPKVVAQIDRLDLSWEPDRLWDGYLLVHDLGIEGVRIQDDTPLSDKAPDLRWPQVSETVRRMGAKVTRFTIKGVSYRHLQEPPVDVAEFGTSLELKDGVLSLSKLNLNAPQGRASGELVAGLWRPSLRLDLSIVPVQPVREMDLFSLQTRLLPGRDPEQMAGSVALAGRSGGAQRLELGAELGVTRTGFNVRKLRLVRPGERGTLTGNGSMTLTKGEPLFSFALAAADLDLSQELKQPTRLSGTLIFSGTPANYLGKFALTNSGAGWQSASLAADYRGGKAGVKLAPLAGTVLEGRLRGALDIVWSEGVRVSGALTGRGLNPQKLAADWTGLVNLDLSGAINVPEQGEMSGALSGKLLESRLQGRDLRGELQASFAGENVKVERLFLTGKGFDLRGAGELDRRLNLTARVSDLSGLLPGAAGRLQAGGWVRWRDGLLSGALSGEGSDLAAAGVSAKAVRLDARLAEGKDYPVHLDASLSRLLVGRVQVQAALLTLQGTAARHTLKADLTSPGTEAHLALAGGYHGGVWSGELTRLFGRDGVGPWSLASPAPLVLSAQQLRLAPLVLNGVPGERVEMAAELNLQRQTGAVRGAWGGLNLARANPWLNGVELAGGSSGDLRLRLLPGERIILSGRIDAQGTLVADGRRVSLERLAATLEGDGGGLRAVADLTLQDGAGAAHLVFRSPEPAALALPERGDLTLQWSNLDLALLRPFMPAGVAVDGRLAGLVTGKLLPRARLDLKGNAALDKGNLDWRTQEQELLAAIDMAQLSFNWRGAAPGAGKGDAGRLQLNARAVAAGTYTAKGERIAFGRMTLRVDADQDGTRAGVDLSLEEGGTLKAAFSSAAPAGPRIPETGDLALEWRGIDAALLKPWLAGAGELVIEGRSTGSVTGKLLPGGKLDAKGEATLDRGHVNWRAPDEEFDASVDTAQVGFSWRGGRSGGKGGAGQLQLTARADATGTYTAKGERIAFGRLTLRADAGAGGTNAGLDLALDGGGTLTVALSSNSPASLGLPETGDVAMKWSGIDPALLKPWLPGALNLEGELSGEASGRLLPGQRLEMTGQAEFSQGRAKWQGDSGELNANLRSASLSFAWRGESLTGSLTLALAEYGRADGSFTLPVPARLPVLPDRNGALQGTLSGKVRERGFLTAFLPGLMQESHGELDLDLRLAGIWSAPRLAGSVQLAKAGAYLPTAGIRVSEVQLSARLEGDQVRVENFRAVSGAGHIEGSLQARLEGWQVAEYSGTLSGERFQTVYLPELQMVTSPQLSFNGGGDKITLRGELRVPEMLISGPPVRQIVRPSEDVILEGAPSAAEEKRPPIVLDGRVRVVLGGKVKVEMSGIDAQLGGSMYLVLQGLDNISSSGEIRVVKGRYRAYGMDLEIVRGRLYYVNDPVDHPSLDILALRAVGDVRAGVTVAGILDAPIVKLYSEPPMPEVDILAYMVLGHPLGASSEEGSMMALAATSLLSLGESSSVHEQIKDRLGLSVFGLQTVDTSGAGRMGYKEIPVAPAGEAAARPAAAESLLTVGKYLTPKLYLSYGRSLVTGGNLFMLRYDISRHWQLETQSGSESGADLYYKLEFN